MTTEELVAELRGAVCRCGRPKEIRRTLCRRCYLRLPVPLRVALYAPIGDGYEIAYDAAVLWLREHPA